MPLLSEQGARYSPIRSEDHWFRGEDKKLVFKVTDETGGVPNMGAWTFSWFLTDNPKDDEPILTVPDADITIVSAPDPDAPQNTIDMVQVPIERLQTQGLPIGRYFHALVRTDAGNWHVLATGEAELQASAAG